MQTHNELDALYDEFKANGALIVSEPQLTEHDWGVWKDFSVKDLDGYVITIHHKQGPPDVMIHDVQAALENS
ncbi:hypothetical protein PaecuDRAFT_0121 [Paenibacillus curdlanolyticus YK9]|uniref:VOC domain-containing protein n=1 Tax=Paenibacillus curdlanolyticus YK9 TaxID=717606 RepID=E0I4S9_9BACL|nr:hypothetical protein [Paenibacillus curdlanolyticus]EFM12610.1 hypothetical protein PaecuDRAFT_0121 [Paenibacillus curdlanolyticus YK9]